MMLARFRVVLALAAALPPGVPLGAQAPAPRPITLGEAIARGRSSGVQAALARLNADASAMRQRQRGADLLPSVTASGSLSRQTINLREFGLEIPGFPPVTDPFTLFRGKLEVQQLIYSRATYDRLKMARDTAIAAGLDADRVGELAAAAAASAWLRLSSAQETVLARQQDSIIGFSLIGIATDQVDAGTAARIERTRTETQGAAIRTQLAVARNEVSRAQLDLARALDLPPTTVVVATGDPVFALDGVPTDADAAVATAKAHRQDLAAERQRNQVANLALKAVRDEFWPTLGSTGFVQSSGLPDDHLYRTWSIGLGLSWPIFDGFRRERRADEQRIRVTAADLRLRDLETQVETDARMAVLDLASAREQVALATTRMQLAEQELREAQERFAAGVAGSVETTTAQGQVAAARDALIQARVTAGGAQVGAARALGLLDQVH
jgi:outer membrane protein TolC